MTNLPPHPTTPHPSDHLPHATTRCHEQAEEARQDDEREWLEYIERLVRACREGAK